MKVTRTWRRADGELVTRVYDYPGLDRRRYVQSGSSAARAALEKGPLTLDGAQRKFLAGGETDRAFAFRTINQLIADGIAVREGNIVRRAA